MATTTTPWPRGASADPAPLPSPPVPAADLVAAVARIRGDLIAAGRQHPAPGRAPHRVVNPCRGSLIGLGSSARNNDRAGSLLQAHFSDYSDALLA